MKNIKIDNLVLTDKMVAELTAWYSSTVDSVPESFITYISKIKNTLIRLLFEDNKKFD